VILVREGNTRVKNRCFLLVDQRTSHGGISLPAPVLSGIETATLFL
jgi:hypothetical protein